MNTVYSNVEAAIGSRLRAGRVTSKSLKPTELQNRSFHSITEYSLVVFSANPEELINRLRSNTGREAVLSLSPSHKVCVPHRVGRHHLKKKI